jgi:hypothetical protein
MHQYVPLVHTDQASRGFGAETTLTGTATSFRYPSGAAKRGRDGKSNDGWLDGDGNSEALIAANAG